MDELLRHAIAGTARAGNALPAPGSAAERLAASAEGNAPEREILLRAGARAAYDRAGMRPVRAAGEPDPAPDETLPECSPAAAQILARLLENHEDPLLLEACARLRLARRRLPFALLPAALGIRWPAARAVLPPVLGARGAWLARQNPEWDWAAGAPGGEAEAAWEEGRPAERLDALRRTRAEDPARAREWAATAWRAEKADFRAQVVDALETGLSPEDEPFLERCLDDRSATVRARAARLLARLPSSAFAERIRTRAGALLHPPQPEPRGGGLRDRIRAIAVRPPRGYSLMVSPLGAPPEDWQRDGVEPKGPGGRSGMGWILPRTLGYVPPRHWEGVFGATPAQLTGWTDGHDWGVELLEGWSNAALLFENAAWAGALWDAWERLSATRQVHRSPEFGALVPLIARGRAEEVATRGFRAGGALSPHARATLTHLPAPWSADLGHTYVEAVRRELARGDGRSGAHRRAELLALSEAWYALPAPCLDEALRSWILPEHEERGAPSIRHALDRALDALRTRKTLIEEIPV